MFRRKSKQPEDVFTPRSAQVNPDMYIPRPGLETSLRRGLLGNLHVVLHGESGTGKTWLYKKVFADDGVRYEVSNLALAASLGGIREGLAQTLATHGEAVKTEYSESKHASADAMVAKGGLGHVDTYAVGQRDPFEALLKRTRQRAGRRPAALVLDNLEAAFKDKDLLDELANIIILCDDERYSAHAVKVIIVGVPSGLKEYFYKTPNQGTVANRLHELPEVSRLTESECADLVRKGFVDELGYGVDKLDAVTRHISWVTDRIPQKLHEYCLELARVGLAARSVSTSDLAAADEAWLGGSMAYAYSAVEGQMNERETKAGRRNQTLFTLARCPGEQFKAPEVEAELRKQFPTSTKGVTLNVSQVLSGLASDERPIIRRSPKGDAYSFVDPTFRMALRGMLTKTDAERVEKRPISSM